MQRSNNTSKWQKVRRLAWDRDRRRRAVCHICKQPINYSLKPSSAPLAWEPDHLELDLANIAPSHRQCNRQRGNGTHDNDLGRRSRIW